MTKMNRKSDEAGFIAVYPNGTGWPRAWNSGNKLGERRYADDVGFISALIDTMIERHQIDTSMIYATGFSNGGMMSHRLGCQLSERIAAIAPVSGGLVFADCQPERPVPVIGIHARNDPVVRYEGDTIAGVRFYSIQDGIEEWARINGCNLGPDTMVIKEGKAWRQRWWNEDGIEVILWTTRRGGHTWPSGRGFPFPSIAFPSRAIDANDEMWEFFQNHTLESTHDVDEDIHSIRDEETNFPQVEYHLRETSRESNGEGTDIR
jgi:polyhydroxybutyrate depolymerase